MKQRWPLFALIGVLAIAALWRIHKSTRFQFFGTIVSRVETTEKVIALTFDDGPTPQMTDKVIAALDRYGIRATFFVTGSEVSAHMDEARKLVAAGHELGNHSYSHKRMVLRPLSFYRDEISRTDELIRAAGHTGDIHFRPPYGKKLLGLPCVLERMGKATVTWDLAPDSSPASGPEEVAARIIGGVKPGSIILLHVMYRSRADSLNALAPAIEGLMASGYRFVTVTEMLGMR